MAVNILVYDTRVSALGPLTEPAPRPDSEVLFTDRMMPLDRLIGNIFDISKARGPIGVLRLMCKPLPSHVYAADPLNGKYTFWMGLQLATGVDPEGQSYGTFAPLYGRVRTIIVYAGMAMLYGKEFPEDQKPVPDGGYGRLLMQQLADQTQAEVIAPDTQQLSTTVGTAWDLIKGRPWVVDFGVWEGQLWRYTPGQEQAGAPRGVT
jgi:hypothetical protein